MKRLTSKAPLTEAEVMNLSVTNLYVRLKEYEDTGLTPEEVEDYKMSANLKLTQDLIDSGITPAIIGTPLTHLLELAKAETEGRLLILPCTVGDAVYHPLFGEGKLRCIYIRSETQFLVTFDNESHGYFEEDFGKTVFLTREEAEAALMGGADG